MARQLFEYHPTFGHRFIPDLKARVDHEAGGYLLKTNQAGFRCRHEVEPRKKPGSFRVLLFGDSYTAGDGVSNKDRYGDQLEKLNPELEVLNFGLSGSGTDQQYLIWKEHAAGIEHDLVVIGVLVENIRRVAAQYRQYAAAGGEPLVLAKPYFTLNAGDLQLHNVPVPKEPISEEALDQEGKSAVDRGGRFSWLRSVVNRMGPTVKAVAQRVTRYQPLPGYDDENNVDWQLMRAILMRWIEQSERPVVVCPIPLYQYIEDSASPAAYQARFGQLVRDSGATLHDPLADFRKFTLEERRGFRFQTDCHLTPAGHRVLAESLTPLIQERMA